MVEGAPVVVQSAQGGKDPGIAAAISAVCLLIVAAPGIGYLYLGNMRKGVIYIAAVWACWVAVVVCYIAGAMTGVGAVCCLPLFLVPFAFGCAVVYDVYLTAKGDKQILPNL